MKLDTIYLLHAWLAGLGVGRAQDADGADHPGRDSQNLLRTTPAYRRQAWRALAVWHEHTWGSWGASEPEDEDASTLWHHKAKLVYEARSLSRLLARDGAAVLVRLVNAADAPRPAHGLAVLRLSLERRLSCFIVG